MFSAARSAERSLWRELACGPLIEVLHRSCSWLNWTERATRCQARASGADSKVYHVTFTVGRYCGWKPISSRIAGPGELFSSDFYACAQSPRWAMHCSLGSVSCSCDAALRTAVVRKRALPIVSSLLSEQRKTWLIFVEQIEIYSLTSYFRSKKRKSKVVRRRRRKNKKTTRSTCGGHSRPPSSIVDLLSLSHCRSFSKSVVFGVFKFVASLTEVFYYQRSLPFFSTKPRGAKLFSGPLEASQKRPVDGASTVRRLSLRLTRFSCILVMDRKKLWFPWPFSKRKMKCAYTLGSRAPATFSESAELSWAFPIFRGEKFAEPTRHDTKKHEIMKETTTNVLFRRKARSVV